MIASPAQQFQAPVEVPAPERFELFIRWAEPFGTAQINDIHQDRYLRASPWFEYSHAFLPNGHHTLRSWFIKAEHASEAKIFNRPKKRTEPKILRPECLIPDCKYLHFAKAYLNVMVHLRGLRSQPKAMVTALCLIERELRNLNSGQNDPELITHLCFTRAAQAVLDKDGNPSSKYDIGQELQFLAGMLQSGYHSKSFRYSEMGFRLIVTPFSFRSVIPQAARPDATPPEESMSSDDRMGQISSEAIAALGIAYADAKVSFNEDHAARLMASLPGLALTTVSMRMSDLAELRSDALYVDQDTNRTRIRIYRPKPDEHQDLPIADKLEALATEYFKEILHFGEDAREAFGFYLERFGDCFKDIDQLYIPAKHRELLSHEFLTCDEAWHALGFPGESAGYFPQKFDYLPVSRAIRLPNGKLQLVGNGAREVLSVGQIIAACHVAGVDFKPELNDLQLRYLTRTQAYQYMRCSKDRAAAILSSAVQTSIKTVKVIRTSELLDEMLKDFKAMPFPNWPYASKSRVTRLDQALLVWSDQNSDPECDTGNQIRLWWRPTTIAVGTINSWISGNRVRPPILFQSLDILLAIGQYPSITIHQTRKRHHTQALLAGVNETFADQLAGRKSGRQGQYYDRRTAKDILSQSIEGFDPDSDYVAIGPAMKNAPPPIKVVERRTFMFNNLAPKQLTDVGGCRTDWSLNPCEMYGNCMRCDKSVWQKGDQKRLPRIMDIHLQSTKMLAIAQEKLRLNPSMKTIERHIRQFEETIFRCEWIFAVEADLTIAVGTIVSFDAAPTAFSSSELASHLRKRREERQQPCACH